MSANIQCQLWMGGVEPYMNEGFIMMAFQRMGEKPLSVKVMRSKITGELCGYCFVHFETDEEAIKAMHKLNGKFIPNSNPPSRFRLNNATSHSKITMTDREFSLWVGDLSPDVDDYQLYKAFASRYESIRAAKVIMDSVGYSKGYGFVQFANPEEQKHALTNMNGFKGLGNKQIKISTAVPKAYRHPGVTSTSVMAGGYNSSQDYSQYYDTSNYWQSYSAWQSYYDNSSTSHTQHSSVQQVPESKAQSQEDDLELIDHNTTTDVEAWNREVMERDYNLWDAVESSKWLPLETFC